MNPTATDPTLSHLDDPTVYGPQGRSPWLDVDWRKYQRWVILDGQPVNVIELGVGPPLVFVHGLWLLPNSWDRWRTLFEAAGFEERLTGR